MGGPLWQHRTVGGWSIPKGELDPEEEPEEAARREFTEETGLPTPAGKPLALGEVRQPSRKLVSVWAIEGDLDAAAARSGTFPLEWPPGSGHLQHFPELDRVEWVGLGEARQLLLSGQVPFLDRLESVLDDPRRALP